MVAWCYGLALVPDAKQESRSDYVRLDRQSSHVQDTLGKRSFSRIAQIGDGFSVSEHPVTKAWIDTQGVLDVAALKDLGLMVLAVREAEGELTGGFSSIGDLKPGDCHGVGFCDGCFWIYSGFVTQSCIRTVSRIADGTMQQGCFIELSCL